MKQEQVSDAVKQGRERIAKLAEKDGEVLFARQVRAGCWDHRSDVSQSIEASTH